MSVRETHPEWFVNMDELDRIYLERSEEAAAEAYNEGYAVYSTHLTRTFPDYFNQVATVISDQGWKLVSTTDAGDHSLFVVFNRNPSHKPAREPYWNTEAGQEELARVSARHTL